MWGFYENVLAAKLRAGQESEVIWILKWETQRQALLNAGEGLRFKVGVFMHFYLAKSMSWAGFYSLILLYFAYLISPGYTWILEVLLSKAESGFQRAVILKQVDCEIWNIPLEISPIKTLHILILIIDFYKSWSMLQIRDKELHIWGFRLIYKTVWLNLTQEFMIRLVLWCLHQLDSLMESCYFCVLEKAKEVVNFVVVFWGFLFPVKYQRVFLHSFCILAYEVIKGFFWIWTGEMCCSEQ